MCDSSDLGRQEPRGCRYVYGDPGSGEWHYCQGTVAEGGKAGDAQRPPYCAHHTKVCVLPHKPFRIDAKWLKHFQSKNGVFDVDPERGDRPASPFDALLRLQERGVFLHD